MKICIAQLNPVVGDIDGNIGKIADTLKKTASDSPDCIVFSELFITGYPPRDLLKKPWFVTKTYEGLKQVLQLSGKYPETGIICGVPLSTGEKTGRGLYNAAVLLYRGKVLFQQNKSLLPVYDVFDEVRYFDPAQKQKTVSFKDEVLGISICEDSWNDPELWPRRNYNNDPMEELARQGATVFINISASPFQRGKELVRYSVIRNHARKHGIPFIFTNQTGANDELIFDGRSFSVDGEGEPVAVFPSFTEHVGIVDTTAPGKPGNYVPAKEIANVCGALLMGIKDYLNKCGFEKVIIGLSGGIDSAVTCALAVQALGKDNVSGVSMPGPYSSAGSRDDALKLARNLGISCKTISVSDINQTYLDTLNNHFNGKKPDITEENIQARIRGNILMALSNKFGCLVLATGNKSELAVGYCTLYGDMSGGLCVLSDVPKTMVYELAEYLNRKEEIIPEEIIAKAPSAELRPDQKDSDTLPPYEILDAILQRYVDENCSISEIIADGFAPETVKWIIREVNRNEYKRRQAAPGLKVTSKAFGIGRRMPVAAKYSE